MNNFIPGGVTIFTLHRVSPKENNKISANENLKVSPAFLETFIQQAREKGHEFIGLDELCTKSDGELYKNKFIITLDDGYKDNFEYAFPIFQKLNVPFAIYVTTSFPENEAILWWYELEDLILRNEKIKLGDDSSYVCATIEDKNEVFLKIREKIISKKNEDLENVLSRLFGAYNINWKSKVKDLALTWEEIKVISQSKLATIGAHTKNHFVLSGLSEKKLIEEILESRQALEEHIEKKVEHFCYPFGGKSEASTREFDVVKNLGFKTATTTQYGHVFKREKRNSNQLPRVMLTEGFNWHLFYLRQLRYGLKVLVESFYKKN